MLPRRRESLSFARLDDSGNVVEVREKVRISDNCTLGAYYFSSARLFTGSCMRNFIPMTAKWRRMRSISHHCIIL